MGPSHERIGGVTTDPPGSIVAGHVQVSAGLQGGLPGLYHLEGFFPVPQAPVTTGKYKLQSLG